MSDEICAAIALSFAVLVGYLGFIRRRRIAENWKQKLIRKAKRQGSYREAIAGKKETGANGTCCAVYEYQVDGNPYRKKITYPAGSECREQIIIYYNRKNPWQAACEEVTEMQGVGLCIFGWSLLTLLAVFFLLMVVFGAPDGFGGEMALAFEEWKFLVSNPQLLIIGAAVLALYGLEMGWILKRQDAQKRRKKEAVAAGRTVTGTRIKAWTDVSDDFQDRASHAIYEYEANGKKYRKSVSSKYSDPPGKLVFYYTKSPEKVFSDYDRDIVPGLLFPVLFFLPLAVVYFCARLLGVDLELLKNL
ncbi:MAG: hypothetical protein HDT26_01485 [Subdoligranulum sp.]|nr:hypothetical protein [Subdoligranulum sp.]